MLTAPLGSVRLRVAWAWLWALPRLATLTVPRATLLTRKVTVPLGAWAPPANFGVIVAETVSDVPAALPGTTPTVVMVEAALTTWVSDAELGASVPPPLYTAVTVWLPKAMVLRLMKALPLVTVTG